MRHDECRQVEQFCVGSAGYVGSARDAETGLVGALSGGLSLSGVRGQGGRAS